MDATQKLSFHLEESLIHINRLWDVLGSLKALHPLSLENFHTLKLEDKDKLDVLAFRFAKLQDLLGTKIFREYLSVIQYPVEDKNYLDLLKELEKENILSIDLWSEFRGVRNNISHDYPSEEEEKVEATNYLITHIEELIEIARNIKERFETIK